MEKGKTRKLTRRILRVVLTIALVMGALFGNTANIFGGNFGGLTVYAATVAGDGEACAKDNCTGTYVNGFCSKCDGYQEAILDNGYYQIQNAGNLYWFSNLIQTDEESRNAKVILCNDITVNEKVLDEDGNLISDTSSLRSWIPIGNMGFAFRGMIYGNDHTIRGLYCDTEDRSFYVGLFGETTKAVIEYVHIEDSYFNGYYAGGVVGTGNASLIQFSTSSATIKGYQVGGIVGFSDDTYLVGCVNRGNIYGRTTTSPTGGIIGRASGANKNYTALKQCCNMGKLTNLQLVKEPYLTAFYTGALVGRGELVNAWDCYYNSECYEDVFGVSYDYTDSDNQFDIRIKNITSWTSSQFADGSVCNTCGHNNGMWNCTPLYHYYKCNVCDTENTKAEHNGIDSCRMRNSAQYADIR